MEGRPDLIRRAGAEAIGTFALVFAGRGAIVTEARHPGTLETVGVGGTMGYEAVLTAFLMFVIMAVATDTRALGAGAAIAIGAIAYQAVRGGPRVEPRAEGA